MDGNELLLLVDDDISYSREGSQSYRVAIVTYVQPFLCLLLFLRLIIICVRRQRSRFSSHPTSMQLLFRLLDWRNFPRNDSYCCCLCCCFETNNSTVACCHCTRCIVRKHGPGCYRLFRRLRRLFRRRPFSHKLTCVFWRWLTLFRLLLHSPSHFYSVRLGLLRLQRRTRGFTQSKDKKHSEHVKGENFCFSLTRSWEGENV